MIVLRAPVPSRRMTRRRRVAAPAVLALLLAACSAGPDTDDPTGAAATVAESATSEPVLESAEAERIRAGLEAAFEGLYPEEVVSTGRTVEVDLVADEAAIALVDGPPTAVWAYNGSVSGPPIELELGDTLQATLRNELPAATSIHWHGIRVPNDMDGVPGLNQSAVQPGEAFTYAFTPKDPGTYWYHSHTLGSEQLDRGLYGPIVVTDPDEADAHDVDVVWMVDDWLLDEQGQVVEGFFDNHVAMHNGRWGPLVTANADPAAELVVRPGQRVRLRLVNASNGRWYEPRIGGIEPDVIAVDGQPTGSRVSLDGLRLAPGNRLDLAFDAPAEPGAYPVVDTVFGAQTPIGTIVVTGDPVEAVAVQTRPAPAIPSWDEAAALPVDLALDVTVGMDPDMFARYRFNGRSYPDVEPLRMEKGRFIKIRITNDTGLVHPIHLHGQFFKVLARDGQPADEPFFRDTVFVEPGQVVDLGIVPLEAGEWLIHCHIQEHADAGMATVALVAEPGQPEPALSDLTAAHVEPPLTGAEGANDGGMGGELDELP